MHYALGRCGRFDQTPSHGISRTFVSVFPGAWGPDMIPFREVVRLFWIILGVADDLLVLEVLAKIEDIFYDWTTGMKFQQLKIDVINFK